MIVLKYIVLNKQIKTLNDYFKMSTLERDNASIRALCT